MATARRTLPLGVAVALLLGVGMPQRVDAQTPGLDGGGEGSAGESDFASASLRWVRLENADTCVSQAELELMVESRLGRGVFTPTESESDIEVAGSIQSEAQGGWKATLVLLRSTGEVGGVREISVPGGACSDLSESVALVLSLMVDMPSPRTLIRLPERTPVQEEPPEGTAWGLVLGLRGDHHVWPAVMVGPSVGLSARFGGAWSLGAHLFAAFSPSVERLGVEWGGSQVGAALRLRALVLGGASWGFGVGVGAEWGALFVRTHGLAQSGSGAGGFGAASVTLWFERNGRGGQNLRVYAGAMMPVTRYKFVYGDNEGMNQELVATESLGFHWILEVGFP